MIHIVLILIVVEDGFVHPDDDALHCRKDVLILIVVEDGFVLDLIRHY